MQKPPGVDWRHASLIESTRFNVYLEYESSRLGKMADFWGTGFEILLLEEHEREAHGFRRNIADYESTVPVINDSGIEIQRRAVSAQSR